MLNSIAFVGICSTYTHVSKMLQYFTRITFIREPRPLLKKKEVNEMELSIVHIYNKRVCVCV